jgi:hypothetical protein
MKKFLIVLGCLVFMVSCATTPLQKPSFCKVDDKSYIYDLAGKMRLNPQSVSSLLVIANFEALKHAPMYTEDACRGAIKNIRFLVSGNPTYYDVMTLVSKNVDYINKYAGNEVVLIGLFVPQLSYEVPITDCDKKCILYHLDEQERMLDTFFKK